MAFCIIFLLKEKLFGYKINFNIDENKAAYQFSSRYWTVVVFTSDSFQKQ
jgi:hypothetical protein